MKFRILHTLTLLFIAVTLFSQEMRIVSGIIKDSNKDPIIGVNVVQKGTANGTMTNIDGYYEIKVPLGSILQFTYIGMRSSEMVVTEANSKPAGNQAPAVKPGQPQSIKLEEPVKEDTPDKKEWESIEITPSKEGQSLSPYFLINSESPDDAWMPLKKTDVTVNIAGVIADVCVNQIYINESKSTLEAVYVFPGSTRAAVYGMAMTIGDRRIEANIKKKEQARQEYEQAKEEGKSTTLLEQHRPNVFQMNVANILPGDTIIVEMRYTELLEHEGGVYEFIYPTVVGPRYSRSGEEWVNQTINRFFSGETPAFSIQTNIQAGIPIRKISSESHNLTIESEEREEAAVSLSNPNDNEGNRDYILRYELQGGKVESGLLRYEHGDENFFLLMIQPPKQPTPDQIPPREYVFIVDVSGSMHGKPISISKELIRNLVSKLRPIDRFNVMLFESSNAMLYKESVAATEENIKKALKVIDKQKGRGGTELYPAIVNAMNFKETEGFSRTFIIITDGFITVEKEAFNYIREHLNKANLFPFGIGSSVNRYLIEGLAHAGMGTPYIVTNYTQAEKIGQQAIKDISMPVLTNISIDWDEWDVYDVEPVAIPDVFAERPILVYGKYRGAPKGSIRVSGLSGDSEYEQTFKVSKAKQEHNQALRYLWARNQIRYYDDYAQYYEGNINSWYVDYGNHQRSDKQIEYVTNLGLKYNLLTKYTSFLAVDEMVRTVRQAKTQPTSTPFAITPTNPESISAPDFQLTEDASLLEEVVVVGYGTQKKSTLTGSVSSVSSNKMMSSPIASLQGRVSGLQVSPTSGEPGDQARIRIRGTGSIMDNSSPMVILDGMPVEYSDFAQMNPNNIESISVLKDASTASVYGAKAANGVLMITSKKPEYKKLSVAWSSSFSVETPNRLPKLQRQYAQGHNESGTPVHNATNEPFSWGPDVKTINTPTYDAYDIFETGHSFRNFLTLSGRKRRYNYRIQLGNNTQQGFIPKSKFTENSVGLQLGRDANSKFSYDIDLGYKNTRGNRLQRGYNMSGIMQGILLTPPTFDNSICTNPDGSQHSAGSAADNPNWMIHNNPFSDETNRFTGKLNLKYQLMNNLSLHYQFNGDYLSGKAKTALNQGSVYNPSGHSMKRDEKFRSIYSRFFVQFDKYWNKIQLNTTIGHEYTTSKRTIDRLDGYHLRASGDYNIQHTDSIVLYYQSFKRHANALFGKLSLDYRQMLIMEAGMRGEWSSVNDKTLLSPSLGLAANLHDLFESDLLSLLKIRTNLSRADKETPLYLDPVYFNSAIYNLNDASNHFESREVIIDDLKPETIRHYEIGTDIGFWNNFITLSASYYWKRGKNQVLPVQVSTSAVQLENAGIFKTHGFEADLSSRPIHNRDFSWFTQLIFSRERSRVTSLGGKKLMLAGIEGVAGSYAIEGQPLGVLYGTAYQRDEQGNLLIGDDGFPVKSDELRVLGDPNPDWRLSWVNTMNYRNFTLSVLFDYKKGGKMWNGTRNVMNYYGTSQYSADHRNTTGYIFPGVLSDGSVNNIPVNFYGNNMDENRWVRYGQYGVAEDGIEDASYLKLREISLGYYIPVKIFQQRTRMKLSVFATNILLYSKYKGVDPDTNLTGASNGFGLDYFNIPGVHSIGMSLNWEF